MEMTKRLLLLIIFSFGLIVPSLQAQDLFYRKNLANVRIDNLSQEQVIKFQRQVESSNMSSQEMEAYLRSKGLSREEITKLKKKMGRIGNTASANELYSIELMNDYFKLKDSLQNLDGNLEGVENQPFAKTKTPVDSLIFGSDLFANSKMTFMPDIQPATPSNYVVGPADVLNIVMFGMQEMSTEVKVTAEGKINLPYVGVVSAAGLTIDQLMRKLRGLFEKNGYASLATGETKLQVTVAEFRTFQVTVIGAKNSGLFLMPSTANVFHVLHAAGGPATQSTYREIEVIRKGKVVQRVDLYKFLVKGSLEENTTLQENDVINLPAFQNRVHLKGEVKKTGLFELKEGESFEDLLRYSGGFNPIAYKERIYVEQITKEEFTTRDIDQAGFANYKPKSGDVIQVGAIVNRLVNRVAIGGAVQRPGYYGWEAGLEIGQLLAKAGGMRENALLTRGLIYRAKRDNSKAYVRFLPQAVLDGSLVIALEDGDSVVIGDKTVLEPDEFVGVVGEVLKPGQFIFGEGLTAMDAILLSGGFKKSALPNRIEIARRIDGRGDRAIAQIIQAESNMALMIKASEAKLEPMDVVMVRPNPDYKPQQVVTLDGEFLYPGPYVMLNERERLSDLIKRAGGLTEMADINAATIIRQRINPTNLKAQRKTLQKDAEIAGVAFEESGRNEQLYAELGAEDAIFADTIVIDLQRLMHKKGKKHDLYMSENDVVKLPKQQNTVSIKGEINNTLTINYTGRKLKPYLRDAGGTTKLADKRRVFVVEPNGKARSTKRFLGMRAYPKVMPGSVVVVPPKIIKEDGPADPAQIAAASSIIASTSSLLFIIITLLR
jgi:protein involved in polysaccharide export with SLBB domain